MNESAVISTRRNKIAAINGLRGIAILSVVAHHLFIPYFSVASVVQQTFQQDGLLGISVRAGAIGVDLFFVLSGFVLYLPFLSGTRGFQSNDDVFRFYRHRANRLLPLYFIVVLVGLLFRSRSPIASTNWFLELIGLLTALSDFSPHGFMPPSNVVLWSVGVEIWFSVLFPFFVLAISRWGVWPVFLVTLLCSLGFLLLGLSIHVERVGHFAPFTNGVLGKAYEFLIGMLVCKLFIHPPKLLRFPKKWYGLGTLLALALLVFLVDLHDEGGSELTRAAVSMLLALCFGTLLLGILKGPRSFSRALEIWLLQLLGCMCYSIYAWHGIILNVMIPSESQFPTTVALLPVFLAVTFGLSLLSYRYIEFGATRDWRLLFLLPTAPTDEPMPSREFAVPASRELEK